MAEPHTPVRADLPPPSRMLTGRTVYRVVWKLNTDVLVGYCWCGVPHEATDPIELWDWLLAHPDTHGPGDAPDGGTPPVGSDSAVRELVKS
ncbi:hypothetical protein [Nocardioides sp. Iso805N]|uniref:hypothetical protein n=1 Tax=Nocardioides sp. Iso805N TaxID=1283287 RepID=UPI0009DAC056|nr:hypothetical protein [Nocardioides sp. Iso805N]